MVVYYMGIQKLSFVAPMPEANTPFQEYITWVMYEPLHPSQKSIVVVPICSGIGATIFIF